MIYSGYIRRVDDEADFQMQKSALLEAGCKTIIEGEPGPWTPCHAEALVESTQPGGKIVVYRHDVLANNLRDLISLIDSLLAVNVSFSSLTEDIDTDTMKGRSALSLLRAMNKVGLQKKTCSGPASIPTSKLKSE